MNLWLNFSLTEELRLMHKDHMELQSNLHHLLGMPVWSDSFLTGVLISAYKEKNMAPLYIRHVLRGMRQWLNFCLAEVLILMLKESLEHLYRGHPAVDMNLWLDFYLARERASMPPDHMEQHYIRPQQRGMRLWSDSFLIGVPTLMSKDQLEPHSRMRWHEDMKELPNSFSPTVQPQVPPLPRIGQSKVCHSLFRYKIWHPLRYNRLG
jgi:hypothetical protein